jgi:hypothetical protein
MKLNMGIDAKPHMVKINAYITNSSIQWDGTIL